MSQLLAGKMQLDRQLIAHLATTFETSAELWQRLNDQYIDDCQKIANRRSAGVNDTLNDR